MAQCLTCDKRLLDEYHGDEIAAELLRVADVISEPTPTRSPGRSPPTSPNSKTRSSAATRGYCATTAPTTTFPAGSLPSSTTQHSPPTSPLRRRGRRPGDKWHLDEVFVQINGAQRYLWRAVDQHGNVLDILVQSRRNAVAAKKFFRRLLTGLR